MIHIHRPTTKPSLFSISPRRCLVLRLRLADASSGHCGPQSFGPEYFFHLAQPLRKKRTEEVHMTDQLQLPSRADHMQHTFDTGVSQSFSLQLDSLADLEDYRPLRKCLHANPVKYFQYGEFT